MLILARSGQQSAAESANSIPESPDSTTDFVIVNRLPVLNMFPHRSSRPTVVAQLLLSADCKTVQWVWACTGQTLPALGSQTYPSSLSYVVDLLVFVFSKGGHHNSLPLTTNLSQGISYLVGDLCRRFTKLTCLYIT